MSVTKKMLKGLGLTDEQAESILEAHAETIEGLKAERDRYKGEAESLPELQRKLKAAEDELAGGNKDSWKVKYEALKEDFENHKAEISKKETRQAKETAYRELLKKCGVSEKRLAAVLKVSDSDIDSVELDEDGSIKTATELEKAIKEEWADFITTVEKRGAITASPPATTGGGSTKTKEEIMNMKDAGARQKAILENPQLFGIN